MQNAKTNSPRHFFNMLLVSAAMAVGGVTSGCLAVAVGAGAGAAVAYVRGELRGTVSAGYDPTIAAANRAVHDLEFVKVSERHDATMDVIVARTAADKKVEIRTEHLAKDVTTVKIRVGWLGDEPLSITILEKIKSHL